MKIDFEHLGNIDKGSIELNDFTIFCGKNNSGKTYAMYSAYGFLHYSNNISLNPYANIKFDFVEQIIETLKQEGCFYLDIAKIVTEHQEEITQKIEKNFESYLPNLFGVSESYFSDTKIKFNLSSKEVKKIIEKNDCFFLNAIKNGERWEISFKKSNQHPELTRSYLQRTDNLLQSFISERLINIIFFDWRDDFNSYFLLPAERAGINLFFKELFSIRNLLLQQAQNDNVDPMFFLKDIVKARYAQPIKDYLQYLSMIGSTRKETSVYQKYAQEIEKNVLGGKYQVDEFGDVYFTPSESKNTLPLHFSSSTVKTLFGLVFYLEHLANEGDYLMIDEPELNLHPDNQRQVARILAQLVNVGLKVIVSTHSDYFVRELNNLIMLKTNFTGAQELQQEYGYKDNELLDGNRISAYLFDNNEISTMDLDDEGISAKTFNDVINQMNESSNKIYYAMQDAKELESW
jgi:predicted ATPase